MAWNIQASLRCSRCTPLYCTGSFMFRASTKFVRLIPFSNPFPQQRSNFLHQRKQQATNRKKNISWRKKHFMNFLISWSSWGATHRTLAKTTQEYRLSETIFLVSLYCSLFGNKFCLPTQARSYHENDTHFWWNIKLCY